MTEWWAELVIHTISTVVIGGLLYRQTKFLKEQIENLKKQTIDNKNEINHRNSQSSLELCFKFANPEVNSVFLTLKSNMISGSGGGDMDLLLIEYEKLAAFWSDYLIKLKHIKIIHGDILNSEIINTNRFQTALNNNLKYPNLVKLTNKIKKDHKIN